MSKIFGKISATIEKDISLGYVLSHWGPSNDKALIVCLHGAGERGMNISRVVGSCLSTMMPEKHRQDFVVLSPQCPPTEVWEPDAVAYLINNIVKQHSLDRSRIYVTGYSMGGRGTWDFATEYPNIPAAIAPICGFSCYLKASKIAQMPTWAFHGANDDIVPVEETYKMVGCMRELGGKPRVTIFKNTGHEGWGTVYSSSLFYNWSLSNNLNKGNNEQDLVSATAS